MSTNNHSSIFVSRPSAYFFTLLLVGACILFGGVATAGTNALASGSVAVPTASVSTNDFGKKLLQFTSAGHILGFARDGVIIASAHHLLKVNFLNSSGVVPDSGDVASGESNASKTRPLGRVTYKNIWDGVTVVYEASGASVAKSTYYLDATKDGIPVDHIRLGYNHPVQIDEKGNLLVAYEDGIITENAPVAWQVIEGVRKPVTVTYVLHGEREVGFSLGDYIPGIPVVIDPTMTWNTFLGGSGNDYGLAVAVDSSGNVYVSGFSDASWGAPVRAYAAGTDGFVAKFDSSGALQWNTFLGGNGSDSGRAIAVDGSGNVYVAGQSDATWGSPVRAYAAGTDGFVAKFDSSGALQWNTFLGGNGTDYGLAIAVDGSGNVYVGGYGNVTWGSPVRAYTSGYDAFAAKLNSSGTLTWNTFLGGSGFDSTYGIAVDGSGNVYVVGNSNATWGSPVRTYTSGTDAFAAKLNSSGTLTWNTFLGGTGNEQGIAIAVDGSGNVYVGGYGGVTWGSPVRTYTSGPDAFAVKLNSSGTLTWNTFLGGAGTDYSRSIAVDGSGNVYVAGQSDATWGSPVRAYTSGTDGFSAKLNSSGTLTWNTFLGGAGSDIGYGIAVDSSGKIYIGGQSDATWGSPVRAYTSGTDGFVAKLDYNTAPIVTEVTPVTTPASNQTPHYTFSSTAAGTIMYGSSCTSANTSAVVGNNTVTFSTLAVGTYTNCTITVIDAATNHSNTLPISSFTIVGTPPTVTAVDPADTSNTISPGRGINATFSKAMDPATITASTFVLKKGAASVTGVVSYSGLKATFVPNTTLDSNTVYTATITTGATDAAGDALAADYTWSFTTGQNYTAWIDHGVGYTAPSGSAYYPSVMYNVNGFGSSTPKYKMWYADGSGAFYLATSLDGVTWGAPTTMIGITNVHHVQVLYDASCFGTTPCNDTTTKYRIWFWDMGANLYSISSLATAESADGIHWSNKTAITQDSSAKLVQDPDLGVGWNRGTYGPVSLFYQAAATNTGTEPWNYRYVMYYDGTDGGHEGTGLAYSIDGLQWSAYSANPVLSGSSIGAWDCYSSVYGAVYKDADGYHYFYSGKGQDDGNGNCIDTASNNFDGIGHASSIDGKTWVKDVHPIFHISDGASYRSGRIYTPSVIHDGSGILRMYFSVTDATDSPKKIGYATLTALQFSLDNPGDVSAGTRIEYTVSRKDYYGTAVTVGTTTVYLYSSSTGSNKKFYDAASGGNVTTAIEIPDGLSSVKFWAYDEKAGNWSITASDNAASPDAVGIADASDALTVQPAAVAKFLLNNPGDMSIGTRLGYTVTREDQFNNPVTSGVTLAYFYSSSAATTTAFYSANTDGAPTTFATINDGDATGSVWYYDETSGTKLVTASDSATVPNVDTGITDAVDSVTVSAIPIVATRFVILPPSEAQVGTPAVVTVEAQDDAGNIDTTIQSGVTLYTTGSATGAGLVTMVNGVGTLSLSGTVAETVTLSLSDTQSTHLDVLSTQSLLFSAAPITPATSGGGGGGGGGGSASLVPMITGVQISGHAFPNAFVLVFAVSPAGVTIEGQTTASTNGAFSLLLKGISAGIGFYGIVGVDDLGRTTQIRAFNANYTNTNTLLLLNVELSPALGLVHPTVRRSDVVGFVGFAVPGYIIGAQIDGTTISQTATAATDGSYKILFPTGALTIGSHTVRVQQVSPNGTRSDYTPQKVFNVTTLFTPQTDFNQDGVINVQDWSIFLSRWSSTNPAVHMLDDLNGDGKVDVSDLSIFVRTLKK